MSKRILKNNFGQQAALLLGCLFFFSCENDPETVRQLNTVKASVEEARNIETLMSEGGHIRARLTAPYMLRYQADTNYVEFPRTLRVTFYDSASKPESLLGARYGKYYESLNKVYLRDSVVVFNTKGDTLRTPELWWDQNAQKFYTNKQVHIKKSGNIIFGKFGLEAKQDLSEITIHQPSGIVPVPDSMAAK
jgi:LPS export ABC transporter protein LptC